MKVLFKLISSALFDVPVSPAELQGIDWHLIYKEAKKQTVLGIVGEAIGKLPLSAQPPKEVKDRFMAAAIMNIRSHAMLDHTVAEVVDYFRSHGIEGVVLKGQGVARYYDNPQMRQCGDIDFYIRGGQFEKAKDLAVEHWLDGKEKKVQEIYKHFDFNIGDVEVELHRVPAIPKRPWQKSDFRNWFDAGLEDYVTLRHIDIEGTRVNLPPCEFDAIYIFYHALSHLLEGEGIGLRQLCDWAMVLHRFYGSSDRAALEATIHKFGLERPWQIMGYIIVEYLGLPKEEMPLYSDGCKAQSRRLLSQIMDGGNFGRYSSDAHRKAVKGYWRKKLRIYRTFHRNLTKMWYLSPPDVVGSYLWYTTTGFARAVKTAISK